MPQWNKVKQYHFQDRLVPNNFDFTESTPMKAVSRAREVKYFSGVRRPVWFLYSRIGSQWSDIGKELMRIPIFAASIEK